MGKWPREGIVRSIIGGAQAQEQYEYRGILKSEGLVIPPDSYTATAPRSEEGGSPVLPEDAGVWWRRNGVQRALATIKAWKYVDSGAPANSGNGLELEASNEVQSSSLYEYARLKLWTETGGGVSYVRAQIERIVSGSFSSIYRTIIDSEARSSFLQLGNNGVNTTENLRLQYGSTSFPASGAGDKFLTVNLPQSFTFPNGHLAFFASPQAITSFGQMVMRGAYVNSNNQGVCVVNTAISQDIVVRWMALGTMNP